MTLQFAAGWDEYKRRYADNQAYLDCFTEEQVSAALWRGDGFFGDDYFQQMIDAAFRSDTEVVTIEQGPHQPEDDGDGFTVHVTARWQGYAYHLYLMQNLSGTLDVSSWTV